ncbi:MAG: TIGR00730 family Rossman fold protein [Sporolactobacillus sp.]
MKKTLCVYAGANLGIDLNYARMARQLGTQMVQKEYRLVYGGSSIGLMGELANSMLKNDGEVIGVMPQNLILGEMVHPHLTQLIQVQDMHARKEEMNKLADGFLALPGGIGTFDELFETLCWAQIGIHRKPIGLLNVDGYFNPLIQLIEHSIRHEFTHESNMKLLCSAADPADLLTQIENYTPPILGNKWKNYPNDPQH